MKSICKNIAFSPSGECLLGEKCICEANKLWLAAEPESPEPSQDELWDELARNYDELNRMEENDWEWNRNILKSQYVISRK